MGEIKPFLSSNTFIFDHIFYCTFFIILILVEIDKKENQFGMISFLWYENSQKVTKKSQNLLKVLPKTVLFRHIALIFSLKKPCYLENRVVREPVSGGVPVLMFLSECWKRLERNFRKRLYPQFSKNIFSQPLKIFWKNHS